MKRLQVSIVFCCLLLVFSLVLPITAQESTPTPSTDAAGQTTGAINCDSSLILLAGLAQRYFGYSSDVFDMSGFEYGQYGSLFDMSTMSGETETESEDINTEPTEESATTDMTEATEDASATETGTDNGMGSGIFLNLPVLVEDISCTLLRTSLETFFANEFQTSDWDERFRSGMSHTNDEENSG